MTDAPAIPTTIPPLDIDAVMKAMGEAYSALATAQACLNVIEAELLKAGRPRPVK